MAILGAWRRASEILTDEGTARVERWCHDGQMESIASPSGATELYLLEDPLELASSVGDRYTSVIVPDSIE